MIRIRTGYSFRNAAGALPEVMSRLVEIGAKVASITDRSSTFGWVRWENLAKENGLKPIFGVEIAVTNSIHAKRPIIDHWTFLAKYNVKPINDLVALATEQFRYEPLLTYEQAMAADGVFRIAGARALIDDMEPGADTFLALGPSSALGHVRAALAKGIKLAAASDNRFPRQGDIGFYEIVAGRNASTQTYDQHIQTIDEWKLSVAKFDKKIIGKALYNSNKILALCSPRLSLGELPHFSRKISLRRLCTTGAKTLGIDLKNLVYKERLSRELKLIVSKGYEDYFYIVADLCSWARERMIVGPARGSSAGSLVCFLLGITTVDPIPHDLIFERFIDVNRDDLPDIDIDFSDQRRQMVFDYVNKKYGAERVARLGTVAMFQPRSALKETSGALHIPGWKCDAVIESLIETHKGDSRANKSLEDALTNTPAGKDLVKDYPEVMVSSRMEGHPRHHSQHAAGIIISELPITTYVAIDNRSGAAMCDKKDAEHLNLLKIDALGLTQLSVFEDALELAGLSKDALENIPLDDPKCFQVLNDRRYSGIFQFNGMAIQSISKDIKEFDSFNDIACVGALGRPGPLQSGGAHSWVLRKNKEHPVIYPHPVFEEYLSETLGIVVYQEQVMNIGRGVGGLDWGQVTGLRKAMSLSLGKEHFDQYGDPWKKGAIANGVSKEDAEQIWDDLCQHGAYSFNKSHSVAYGLISYQCCWLKAYYPFEFAAATLSHEDDPHRQIQILREMISEGYSYIPIDSESSTEKWTVGSREGKRVLVGPLSNVKGIGPKIMKSIIAAKARGEEIPERAKKLLENPTTNIDSVWPIRDAFNLIMPDPEARNIGTTPTPIEDIEEHGENDQSVVMFCVFSNINPKDENNEILVARRGSKISGTETAFVNVRLLDDTGNIHGKINRFKYKQYGRAVIDRGRTEKAMYAVKGRVLVLSGGSFKMISIDSLRYIGDLATGEVAE